MAKKVNKKGSVYAEELIYYFKETDRPNELTRHKKREHVAELFTCDFSGCNFVSGLS